MARNNEGGTMLNKRGFVVAPIIFIVCFLIAVGFSYYVTSIDNEISTGVRTSASIQMGIYEMEKERINQVNFAKISIYNCCADIACVENKLDESFGKHEWNLRICGDSFEFNLKPVNATNINMNLGNIEIEGKLFDDFYKCE